MICGPFPVPPDVAERARQALAERARRQGGGNQRAVVAAHVLATSPVADGELVAALAAWHAANPAAVAPDGRCTLLAGLYGGGEGRRWARALASVDTSWLLPDEESATLEALTAAAELPPASPVAAGIALVALDTGRVLMLQRSLDPEDPNGGKWEWPGGKLDPGEAPEQAARREFAEEVGVEPPGRLVGDWLSADGVYRGHIYAVPEECDCTLNADHEDREVTNPDDPDGDQVEVVAWWSLDDAEGNPALRDEVKATPWADLRAVSEGRVPVRAAGAGPARGEDGLERLSRQLQRLDRRFQDRVLAGAQVAVTDALRRAGVKVRQRADKRSRAARETVAAAADRKSVV